MKKLFLSNSQISTYTDCPRKWWLQKIKRLRPNYKGSALLFGSALDQAVEHILLKKEGSFHQEFLDSMKIFDVNGTEKVLPHDILDVRFFAGDIDPTLLEQEVVDYYCDAVFIKKVEINEMLEYCKQQRKAKKPLSRDEQRLFNYMAYESLLQKGLMLLDALDEWIEENVTEVHSVQKKIEIENENGDKFIGYLDFIVTLKDGRKVLIDLKTSSNPNAYYPATSAADSVQLGIYSQEEGITDVAYLVADKKIRKRDPKVRLKFVEGKITEEHLDKVFEDIEKVTIEIKEKLKTGEEVFEKNLDSCMKFAGCEFFNYCKKGCMKGLEYINDKK